MINKHQFTQVIIEMLTQYFDKNAEDIFQNSPLLQYFNIKTKSANKGSKSRPSLGNHYALYVLYEYINQIIEQGNISDIIKEIAVQSKLEFNLDLPNNN